MKGFYLLYVNKDNRGTRELIAVFSNEEKLDSYLENSKEYFDEAFYSFKTTSALYGSVPGTEFIEFLPLDPEVK